MEGPGVGLVAAEASLASPASRCSLFSSPGPTVCRREAAGEPARGASTGRPVAAPILLLKAPDSSSPPRCASPLPSAATGCRGGSSASSPGATRGPRMSSKVVCPDLDPGSPRAVDDASQEKITEPRSPDQTRRRGPASRREPLPRSRLCRLLFAFLLADAEQLESRGGQRLHFVLHAWRSRARGWRWRSSRGSSLHVTGPSMPRPRLASLLPRERQLGIAADNARQAAEWSGTRGHELRIGASPAHCPPVCTIWRTSPAVTVPCAVTCGLPGRITKGGARLYDPQSRCTSALEAERRAGLASRVTDASTKNTQKEWVGVPLA